MNHAFKNASHLEEDFRWLEHLIARRIETHLSDDAAPALVQLASSAPHLNGHVSRYSDFIRDKELTVAERLLVLLSMAPYVRPQALDAFQAVRRKSGRSVTEFGGLPDSSSRGFQPTGETALFLLAGDDLKARFQFLSLLSEDHFLFAQKHLVLRGTQPDTPYLNGILQPSRELIEAFTTGQGYRPTFGSDFPAKYITTQLEWDDLVLEAATLQQLEDIHAWIRFGDIIMDDWGMSRRLKAGYRALFHGPPGTGKTLTATLLGKATGKDVYRIDLSMVVSKYIGETEKNLEKVFARAEDQDWLLFFDEADALFGKRTKVRDAHDRFANQEVSYLLQRVEDFRGIVILASNEKDNIDEAFTRRFQSMIHFPMPGPRERLRLWQQNLPANVPLESGIDLRRLSERYELSGGSMMNVIRFCALCAVQRNPPVVEARDITEGLRREFRNMGRVLK